MVRSYQILLASFIFMCLICMVFVKVKAQDTPIEAEILPSQGNAQTVILIRFRTTNVTIGDVDAADIFWDNFTIALNLQGILGADGSYNYNLTVPTEHPLSDVGNHTIRVDASVFNYGPVTFDFTFTITEFVPSSEYVALNATYYALLINYTNLLDDFNQLLANYTETSTDYTTLLSEHNQLLLNYNSLSSNYNSQIANYNSLSSNYNSLSSSYNALLTNLATYADLQANFESLSSNYDVLRQDSNSLNSTYDSLKSNYDSALGQLTFSRNLNYILIASTTILAVTTIYFAARGLKPSSKTRY